MYNFFPEVHFYIESTPSSDKAHTNQSHIVDIN